MAKNNSKTLLDIAQQIKQKSTDVGFDTNNSVEKAFNKINEEFLELKEEVELYLKNSNSSNQNFQPDSTEVQKEMGDLMFAICALANKLGVRANDCLEMTVDKFTFRSKFVEEKLTKNGLTHKTCEITKMCEWWSEAKKIK